MLTEHQIEKVQTHCNGWTDHYLKGVHHLIVDGDKGHATNVRIESVKFYGGYGKDRQDVDSKVSETFQHFLRDSKGLWIPAETRRAGEHRRARQRHYYRLDRAHAVIRPGVALWHGTPVCKCAVPILHWAVEHGWQGRVNSGVRTKAHSRWLCQNMCGHDTCPGMCAGIFTHHVGVTCAMFALDVSDYVRFAHLMAQCPIKPHIFNALPHDVVHFSPDGH